MLKLLLIALIGYFIFSRLFGRITIIRHHEKYSPPKPPREKNIENIKPKPSSTKYDGGDYIDYEEIK